jgi:voltage-gated potassium channel
MTRRERLREIIFEADTPAGKAFDVGLLIAILTSIVAVMLESVASMRHQAGPLLRTAEWVFTLLFTAEYMYVIEGARSGFTSIPIAMYWAIVTTTTVGYGDIAPVTALGQVIASFAMLLGYSIIAVPTGIVTAEIIDAARRPQNTRTCPHCMSEGHLIEARFCRDCGGELAEPSS